MHAYRDTGRNQPHKQRRHEAETVLGLITFVVCLGLLI